MKFRSLFIILFCAFGHLSIAGEGEFAVSKIPKELLKNAHAVLRLEELRFEIVNRGKAVFKNRCVITILNENGDDWARFIEGYDKHRKINWVEGFLYDAEGKSIKKMKTKDAEDVSGVSESSLIDDNRVKRHSFFYKVYPYTVEYIFETEMNSTLFFPPWTPQGGERLSVERSSFTMVSAPDYNFRYKSFNYKGEPVVEQKEKSKLTTWTITNIPAFVKEPYSPMAHEFITMVIFGPTDFQVEDYKGNMANWLEFGKFVYALKAGKDILPDLVKQKVHAIADGITDPRKKIAALYEYLQKNTRYISIQLGIGGWQPFDAKYVAAKSYGDCKALTNYMYSILKEAGITSYYTLVRAGASANYITTDFPSQQFNHVILCVPLQTDTTWLECTSQTLPAGYLSKFTANRYALLIDEAGGHLVRTSQFGMDENLQDRRVIATLTEDGTLKISASTKYKGLQQDHIHGLINNLSKDKVKEYLHEQLDFATYDISNFDYKEEKTATPSISESLDIVVSNYANITGKRLFIIPNIMARTNRKPAADPDRKYDIELGMAYKDVDSASIEIPAGYSAESMPAEISINSQFGNYKSSVKLSGNKLQYYRVIEFNGGRYPARDYPDFVKFWETIYKADRGKVVLVKAEQPAKGF